MVGRIICWFRGGHVWRADGYRLAYIPGGRRYVERCIRCGGERTAASTMASGPCPECGLPLPGPHRGTCSASRALGGPGFGLPPEEAGSKLRAAVNDAADRGLTVKQLVRVFDEALDAIKRERGE